MSNYLPLWEHISFLHQDSLSLSFCEIKNILGFLIDHSFLRYKKELEAYGWQVDKISLKSETVTFGQTKNK